MGNLTPAPRHEKTTTSSHRRAKAELLRNGLGHVHDGERSLQDSLFRHLDDDLVVLIMNNVINVSRHLTGGPLNMSEGLATVLRKSVAAALGMWSTCRWMDLFSKGRGYELRQEVFCMASTSVAPLDWGGELPFRSQFKFELDSHRQYNHLKTACEHLVTHCASTHCARARRGFNEVLKIHGRVRVAFDLCKTMATARCVPVCVMHTQASVGVENEHFFVVCRGGRSPVDRLSWRSQSELTIVSKLKAPPNVREMRVSPDGVRMLAILDDAAPHHKGVMLFNLETGACSTINAFYPANEEGLQIVSAWFHDNTTPEAVVSVYIDNMSTTQPDSEETCGRVIVTFRGDDTGKPVPWRILHEDWYLDQSLWVDTSERGDCVAVHHSAIHHSSHLEEDAPICTTILTIDPSEDIAYVESKRHTLAASFVPGQDMLASVSSVGVALCVCCYIKMSGSLWLLQHIVSAGPQPGMHRGLSTWRHGGDSCAGNEYMSSTCISPCGRFMLIMLRFPPGDNELRMIDLNYDAAICNLDRAFPIDVAWLRRDYTPREIGWSLGSMWVRTRRGVLHFGN